MESEAKISCGGRKGGCPQKHEQPPERQRLHKSKLRHGHQLVFKLPGADPETATDP